EDQLVVLDRGAAHLPRSGEVGVLQQEGLLGVDEPLRQPAVEHGGEVARSHGRIGGGLHVREALPLQLVHRPVYHDAARETLTVLYHSRTPSNHHTPTHRASMPWSRPEVNAPNSQFLAGRT